MRIGIIGAGNVGSALGHRLAAAGHDVVFGIRDPQRGADAVKEGLPAGARVADVSDAVRGSDAVILATPWGRPPMRCARRAAFAASWTV